MFYLLKIEEKNMSLARALFTVIFESQYPISTGDYEG